MSYSRIGRLLNHRYKISQVLSAGAFGRTYIVHDTSQPGRPRYAVKCYQSNQDYPNLLKTSRRVFVTEAETLKKLGNHPQIPRFIDCFEGNGSFYLVQELIEGQPLSAELAWLSCSSPQEREAQVIFLLRDVLEALDFIHAQGVIHCDVKPNNIIRRSKDGKLVLIDFGASQPVRPPRSKKKIISTLPTQSTVAVSPSGYLAAEQLIGVPYPCSDIYALGIIAIQMLTGLDPAKLQLNLETSEVNWQDYLTAKEVPNYSEELITVITKMVRYDYKERYQSAREVLAILKPLIQKARNIVMESSQRPLEAVTEQGTPEVATLFVADGKSEFEDWNEITEEYQALLEEATANVTPEKPESSLEKRRTHSELKPSMIGLLAKMGIVVAILNAFAIALGIYTLMDSRATEPGERRLAEAQKAFHEGEIEDAIAIAQSIPIDSPVYPYSQTAIAEWQNDWSKASLHYQAAENAFNQEDWQTVLTEAGKVPQIAHWQEKLRPLLQKAQIKAEAEARTLLQEAFDQAAQKNFTQALAKLQQISPETEIGAKIAPKLEEYSQKQRIRAMALLQQAYNHAQDREFKEAITVLEQIPPNTPAGNIAQEKLTEYAQKQKVRDRAASSQRSQVLGKNANPPQPLSQLNPGIHLQEVPSLDQAAWG
ncbi:serine/threonine-protein kinase [Spirulina sp. CS-785/01]|uniref:serine/threonine-protein kinase n=1 Tax=Spirulina sp. CS-785/01 TaxID=3021716 RepID=UPI00232B7A8D|nr:serine/threonine-protein kinase [Spirulina sp. CS-785/01]MDB9315982.1 serine/threonine-protein kinase [Spirulina sp. CS-785/01]